MKKNLEILEIEAKLTKDEKKYWRVKTLEKTNGMEEGKWMSCFEVGVKDLLRDISLDKGMACCEVTEKKGTNFKGEDTIYYNITKCYGEAQETVSDEEKQEEKPEVVRPGSPVDNVDVKGFATREYTSKNNHTTMYVSYAKDIFLEYIRVGLAKNVDMPEEEAKVMMASAIDRVKQAKEAFEEK